MGPMLSMRVASWMVCVAFSIAVLHQHRSAMCSRCHNSSGQPGSTQCVICGNRRMSFCPTLQQRSNAHTQALKACLPLACCRLMSEQCCTSIEVPRVHGVTTPLATQAALSVFFVATDVRH